MKLYRFDADNGRKIDRFGSNFILSRIVGVNENILISCFHLEPDGIVGYHQAVTSQLILVVRGSGWVRSRESTRIPIEAYRAVFWNKGEWHEAGTDSGLTAIVLEGEFPDTGDSMPEWSNNSIVEDLRN